MLKLPVYLDYNATTPCDERVVEAMVPCFRANYGNAASRSHPFGWTAAEAVDEAREKVAALIGAVPQEIVFTSGATEADNLALKGVAEMYAGKGNHIITVATEHKAVLDTCDHLEKKGMEITYLPVKADGSVDLDELEKAIQPNTILIAVMYANNETGTIQPVKEISAIAKKHQVLFFSDATQAAGKIPVDVNEDGIDLLAFSAHKIYGPKGIGALYVRRRNPRVKITAQMDGGGHERGMRSGTLNVPGIVGFGVAAEICRQGMKIEASGLEQLRNRLETELLKVGGVYVNGNVNARLPHVSNLSFKNVDGEALMLGINKEIAVSSGSACTSASVEPSHVLRAMGVSDDLAHSSLRFSLGRGTTDEHIDYTIERVSATVKKLRELSVSIQS
jgi:cysteine desulfurase